MCYLVLSKSWSLPASPVFSRRMDWSPRVSHATGNPSGDWGCVGCSFSHLPFSFFALEIDIGEHGKLTLILDKLDCGSSHFACCNFPQFTRLENTAPKILSSARKLNRDGIQSILNGLKGPSQMCVMGKNWESRFSACAVQPEPRGV